MALLLLLLLRWGQRRRRGAVRTNLKACRICEERAVPDVAPKALQALPTRVVGCVARRIDVLCAISSVTHCHSNVVSAAARRTRIIWPHVPPIIEHVNLEREVVRRVQAHHLTRHRIRHGHLARRPHAVRAPRLQRHGSRERDKVAECPHEVEPVREHVQVRATTAGSEHHHRTSINRTRSRPAAAARGGGGGHARTCTPNRSAARTQDAPRDTPRPLRVAVVPQRGARVVDDRPAPRRHEPHLHACLQHVVAHLAPNVAIG